MALEKAGKGLDWLQRGQAAWATLPESAKQWVRGLVGAGIVAVGGGVAARMSNWTPADAYLFAVVVGALALVSYGLFLRLRAVPSESSAAISGRHQTLIRLAFNGNIQPTFIESENVWRWYSLRLDGLDRDGTRQTLGSMVFLTFERQIDASAGVLEVDGGTRDCEVKDFSPRSAVIVFPEELRGNVTIRVRFPATTKS